MTSTKDIFHLYTNGKVSVFLAKSRYDDGKVRISLIAYNTDRPDFPITYHRWHVSEIKGIFERCLEKFINEEVDELPDEDAIHILFDRE